MKVSGPGRSDSHEGLGIDGSTKKTRDLSHRTCSEHGVFECSRCFSYVPTQRPLAEPPMLDYDYFIEEKLPSDIRFSRLFPNDVTKWTPCRDHETEWWLLTDYLIWAKDLAASESQQEKAVFYKNLLAELRTDFREVDRERRIAFDGATDFARWEYNRLDQDGGTKGIEAMPERMWNGWLPQEAFEVYGHLAPPGYQPLNKHWYRVSKKMECPADCEECREPNNQARNSTAAPEKLRENLQKTESIEEQTQSEGDQAGPNTILNASNSDAGTDSFKTPQAQATSQPSSESVQSQDSGFHQQLFDAMYL